MKKLLCALMLCCLASVAEATIIGPGVTGAVFSAYTSVDRVPSYRTVNGQALSTNVVLTASDVGATTIEEVQDNFGGTTGGDGFLKSTDGHLTITYSDATPSLTLGVIGSICYYPTGIEFGSTTQQYDVTGTTWVSAVAGGSLGGIPASSAGDTLADTIDSISTARDSKYLAAQEKTGAASATNPLTIQFLFTGITQFNTINTRSFYAGSISHNVSIQLWNYTSSAWDNYATFSGESDYVSRTIEVFNHAPYVSGGNAKLQFIHLTAGVGTHNIRFDYVALCDGGGGGGSASIASAVAYVPTGGVSASNVQTAINELDTDKMNTDYSNAGTPPTWNQNTLGTSAGLSGSPNIAVGTLISSSVQFGSGGTTLAGMYGAYFGYSSYAALWSTGVTPSTSNYGLIVSPSAAYLNGVDASALRVGNSNIAAASAGGLTVTGDLTVNGGTNTIYRCVGGTNDGAINWKSGGPCPSGTNTITSLIIN